MIAGSGGTLATCALVPVEPVPMKILKIVFKVHMRLFFVPTNPLSRKLSNKWHQLESELARYRSLHYIFLVKKKKKMQKNRDHTFLLGHMCAFVYFFIK